MKSIILVLTSTYLASCIPVPPPHPAVVAVRQEEELLPLYLRSPLIFNPHLQEVLPLTSVLHHGEQPVYHREADNVSRQEVYKILSHAGFIPRRPPLHQPDPSYVRYASRKNNKQHINLYDNQFLHSPDFLQYL